MNVKYCTGPAHGGESVPLPLTDEHWYFRQSGSREGEARMPCKLCRSIQGQKGGRVECKGVLKYVQELERRCGSIERAARFSGIGTMTLYRVIHGGQCTLLRETAFKIITSLDEKRREDRRNGFVHENFIKARREQARIEREFE